MCVRGGDGAGVGGKKVTILYRGRRASDKVGTDGLQRPSVEMGEDFRVEQTAGSRLLAAAAAAAAYAAAACCRRFLLCECERGRESWAARALSSSSCLSYQ